MHLRRAAVAALASVTLFGLAACNKNDTGNNTLVGRKTASPTASGGPQTTAPAEAGAARAGAINASSTKRWSTPTPCPQ